MNLKDILKRLVPVKFRYNGDNRQTFGLIAQELLKLFPEDKFSIVTKDPKGFYQVDYTQLIPILILRQQELEGELDSIRALLQSSVSNGAIVKPLKDPMPESTPIVEKQKVNIFYLTNDCNLDCPYCYEKGVRGEIFTAKEEEVRPFLDEIVQRENDFTKPSTLCLMGGEPMLAFPLIQKFFDECSNIRKETGKSIALNIVSNGTLIHKYKKELEVMLHDRYTYLRLDISYDGGFQHLRTGKSRVVQKNLQDFKKANIPLSISYTVSQQKETDEVVRDLRKILTEYVIIGSLKEVRIRVNFDFNSLGNRADLWRRILMQECKDLYNEFKIPLCDLVCGPCGYCNKSDFDDIQYFVPGSEQKSGSYIRVQQGKQTTFNHFGEQKNE